MDTLEQIMNSLSDQDWGWWPFLFLRPEQDEYMDNILVLKLTLYYGLFFSIVGILFLSATGVELMVQQLIVGVLLFHVFFFALYRVSFATMWNRRASRLQKRKRESTLATE